VGNSACLLGSESDAAGLESRRGYESEVFDHVLRARDRKLKKGNPMGAAGYLRYERDSERALESDAGDHSKLAGLGIGRVCPLVWAAVA